MSRFTQYYCPREQGMILRSGKVINCIINSDLHEELENYINNKDKSDEDYMFHGSPCKECFILFDFLDKHHLAIRNDPHLSKIYYNMSARISMLIEKLRNPTEFCCCHQNTSYRYPFFLDEYYDLVELKEMDRHTALGEKMENYTGYENRKMYRQYHLNFLCMRPRPEMRIFIDSPFHDFTLLIKELQHWFRYFDRHNVSDIKKITAILGDVTIIDCASMITSYLV